MARPLGTTSHGGVLAPDERRELQRLLAEIPVGADCHDPRVVAFCDAWRRYGVPNLHHVANAGHYSIYNLRCTEGAPAELLAYLWAVVNDPTLTVKAQSLDGR